MILLDLIEYSYLSAGGPGSGRHKEDDFQWEGKAKKGWMSRDGKKVLFDFYTDKHMNHRPEGVPYGKQPKNYGFTRFGSSPHPTNGNWVHFLQYDSRYGGKDSAMKTLQYLKPRLGDSILLEDVGQHDENGDPKTWTPDTPGQAVGIVSQSMAASWWRWLR